MLSIRELYRIGTGPSSSHTMAPRRAAKIFLQQQPEAFSYRVTLYGSLAATPRGPWNCSGSRKSCCSNTRTVCVLRRLTPMQRC